MISITDKIKCCGCSACSQKCPQSCIKMKPDKEGFLYPEVDSARCVDCGLCEKVCPIINIKPEENKKITGFVLQNLDSEILADSASGGFFSGAARYVLNNGGVVFGAALDENFVVRHGYAENEAQAVRFRHSKYAQSNQGDCYKKAKSFLHNGRTVLYTGTPCQIEGLFTFLGKEYDNLITIDLVCRAVASPLFFSKYIEFQQTKTGGFDRMNFLEKRPYGYTYSTLNLWKNKASKPLYNEGIDTDPMLRGFYSGICDRPSCHACYFKKLHRPCDFTMCDCFSAKKYDSSFDWKGASRVFVHTDKGERIMEQIKNSFKLVEKPVNQLVKGREMVKSTPANPRREEFFADLNKLPNEKLFQKYFSKTPRKQCERFARRMLVKLGLYNFVKFSAKEILKK